MRIDKIFALSYSNENIQQLKNNGGIFLLTQYMLKHPDKTIRRIACNTFTWI